MSLVRGQKMRRASDGVIGEVIRSYSHSGDLEGTLRVKYLDRGEEKFARPREEWVPALPARLTMRDEEIAYVAEIADLALKSVDENKPFAWWDTRPVGVHDAGMVRVITDYLKARA